MKKPPFNELAKPNMSKEAKAVMEEAMQKSCDEQSKLVDWEPDTDYEKGKEFGKFSAKEVADMIVRDYGEVLKRLSKT